MNRFSFFFVFRQKAAVKKAGEQTTKEGPITTATDDEDAWKKEFASFTPASRKTSMYSGMPKSECKKSELVVFQIPDKNPN